jgi:hypothetical protein
VILCMTPWDDDGNLGRAYNRSMELLGADDWAIFLDHDAMPTTGLWHRQFAEAIAFQPNAGAIVAMTNRIASSWQRCGPAGDEVADHRAFGHALARTRMLADISGTKGFGGVFFAVSKRAWQEVGGFPSGLGCVDHGLHFGCQRIGRKVWMHTGIYAYHWRHRDEPDPTSTFPKAANCQCRGAESPPSVFVPLP